ncbi:MAG: GDSL-type esterase/lipase family protein [Candidatus Pacebacteria bacterium]|nr:GDSL-type esterase/lipase family protein [Candidatus Paceibacterota bacterium]
MKFKGIELLAIILIMLLAASFLLMPKPEYNHDVTIVAFGDSVTAGLGVNPPDKNFVVLLSEYTRIPIINSGQTGDNTSEALMRLQTGVLDKNPDIVIILLGGNDFLERRSVEVFDANLRTIVKKIKEVGSKIIIIGGSEKINAQYEMSIARIVMEEKLSGYVPNVLDYVMFRKDLLFDKIHPNAKGHELIAKMILPVLEKTLREVK